ncbi:hypothetical protein [Nonomuraea soli]|uniref:Uncharacterized protein n=1 Tax=Nonomuraea soli TaxID=1032476 RepID=A0A7W0CJK2_9ACTN|nr:hypothetical protein [Nonomuraea soli]MBA2892127.1 hypothetical protein [Nonomuraea soli]
MAAMSWFDALPMAPRYGLITVAVVGYVGGLAVLLGEPPSQLSASLLILVFAISGAVVFHSVPWVRARIGRGSQLLLGFFLVYKSLSGEFSGSVFRAVALLAGTAILLHLAALAVIRDQQLRKAVTKG